MSLFHVLYQDAQILVIQTHAGDFDKFAPNDIYGEFNLGLHVGDDSGRVLANRLALFEAINKQTNRTLTIIHWLNQIHSDKVVNVDEQLGITPPDADAMISRQKGVGLAIMTADCVPIALFDGRSVACVHAGWQGLASGIIANTIKELQHDTPIKAVIGVCIGQDSYEIDTTLAHTIVNRVCEQQLTSLNPHDLYQTIIKPNTADKCLIDIVKLTKLQLECLGAKILTDDVPCTYQTPNLYSYRAQTHAKKQATGRMATVIVRLS